MSELFQGLQPQPDDEGDEVTTGRVRRRLPLDTASDQERAVKRALRLALSAFLDKPSESMARALATLSNELRQCRQDGTYEMRLQALEAQANE